MSKLFKLKEYLTIPETVKYFSTMFDEEVTEADVLQLVLDDKLLMSVHLVNSVFATNYEKIPFDNKKDVFSESYNGLEFVGVTNEKFGKYRHITGYFLKPLLRVFRLSGTYNLVPGLSGFYDVRKRLEMISMGIEVTNNYERYFVGPEHGWIYELLTTEENTEAQENSSFKDCGIDYYPVYELPDDSYLVVRTDDLKDFERRFIVDPDVTTANDQPEMAEIVGRREQQYEIIFAVIAALDFDSMKIPDKGKSKIKKICLTRLRLFTDAGFEHAWKEGIAAGYFRMENHEKYSPNK